MYPAKKISQLTWQSIFWNSIFGVNTLWWVSSSNISLFWIFYGGPAIKPCLLSFLTIFKPLVLCWSLILDRKLFQWVQVKNLNFILWILKLRKLPWSYYLWKFFRRLMLRNFSLWILKLCKLPWSYYLWKFFRRLMLRHGYCPRKKLKSESHQSHQKRLDLFRYVNFDRAINFVRGGWKKCQIYSQFLWYEDPAKIISVFEVAHFWYIMSQIVPYAKSRLHYLK